MGRHQQAGTARRAHLSLGAGTLAGLMCSAAYALAAPVAAPAAVVSPVAAPVVTAAAPVHTAAAAPATKATATKATATTTKATATRTAAATSKAAKQTSTSCDLSGPPVFGDPAHPDEITNRDCGYVDAQGRRRSHDAWIDDQLSAAG